MTEQVLIDSPSPFAPRKELQAFLDQWEHSPQASQPGVRLQIRQVRQALADQDRRDAS